MRRSNPSDCWRTPLELFEQASARWKFNLDAAADANNSLCENFCSDGLTESWAGHSVWVNPPYSDIMPWVEKAAVETDAEVIVMLLPIFVESKWFARLMELSPTLLFLAPRIKFQGATSNCPHRMMLVVFDGAGGHRVCRWRTGL